MIVKISLLVGLLFGSLFIGGALPKNPVDMVSTPDWVQSFENEEYVISNYPEMIHAPGLIYKKIMPKKHLRFFYHHRNGSDSPFAIACTIQNTGTKPAQISLSKGKGGPNSDIIFAGHIAMKRFLKELTHQPDHSLTIQPGKSKIISFHSLKPGLTSSGILKISKQNEVPLHVTLEIIDPSLPQIIPNQYNYGAFSESKRTKNIHFDSRHIVHEIPIGGPPYLTDIKNGIFLKGNYGLLYQLNISLYNSYSVPTKFKIYFTPKMGVDRGVFLIDDAFIETKVLHPNRGLGLEDIYNVILLPKEQKNLALYIMPQAGCYYPIHFILRSYKLEGAGIST
ncbi:MAG: hypothetical protein HRT90_01545 [Candidatus Margulisbacteria bacterium]|nr:hypothetical protein [Candidatus Margulisiibacteriota bacterium]